MRRYLAATCSGALFFTEYIHLSYHAILGLTHYLGKALLYWILRILFAIEVAATMYCCILLFVKAAGKFF